MLRDLVGEGVSAWRRSLACSCLLIAIGCNSDRDSTHGSAPRQTPGKNQGTAGAPACTPVCTDQCGIDNGCGSPCQCKQGESCTNHQCVANAACASCKANETCVDGGCVCNPQCANNSCGPDGCGGPCPCPDTGVPNADGNLVEASQCNSTCESAAWACGNLCGKECGTCPNGQSCASGKCLCQPKCEASSCRDGCGGTCPCADGKSCNAEGACVEVGQCTDTCKSTGTVCGQVCGKDCGSCGNGQSCVDGHCLDAKNCEDCNLKLQVVDKKNSDGRLTEVTLLIDYAPKQDEAKPRILDLRLRSNKKVSVRSAEPGPALTNAKKNLYVDELTGSPWRQRPDGSIQFLAFGAASSKTIESGQVLKVVLSTSETGPIQFWIVRRAQSFAPLAADQALQASSYDTPAVVTP